MKTHLFGQKNGVADGLVIHLGKLLLGMNGGAVAGQSADLKTVVLDGSHKLLECLFIVEKLFGVSVSVTGVTATADLDHIATDGLEILTSLCKRHIAHKCGENA